MRIDPLTQSLRMPAARSQGDPQSFDHLVYASAGFVGSAALMYSLWVWTFHEHEHEHPLMDDASIPGGAHKHTTQQKRLLEQSGAARMHVHLHFHPPWSHVTHAHRHDTDTHTHYHLHTGP